MRRNGKTVKKSDLPSKKCSTCGLYFDWRKKWERSWEQVKYCSEQCRQQCRQQGRQHSRQTATFTREKTTQAR